MGSDSLLYGGGAMTGALGSFVLSGTWIGGGLCSNALSNLIPSL